MQGVSLNMMTNDHMMVREEECMDNDSGTLVISVQCPASGRDAPVSAWVTTTTNTHQTILEYQDRLDLNFSLKQMPE